MPMESQLRVTHGNRDALPRSLSRTGPRHGCGTARYVSRGITRRQVVRLAGIPLDTSRRCYVRDTGLGSCCATVGHAGLRIRASPGVVGTTMKARFGNTGAIRTEHRELILAADMG